MAIDLFFVEAQGINSNEELSTLYKGLNEHGISAITSRSGAEDGGPRRADRRLEITSPAASGAGTASRPTSHRGR